MDLKNRDFMRGDNLKNINLPQLRNAKPSLPPPPKKKVKIKSGHNLTGILKRFF
jgi:hypothetical protein